MISLLLPCAKQDLSELIGYKNKIIERQGLYDSAFLSCAEHVRQLGGESPLDNLMEVKS